MGYNTHIGEVKSHTGVTHNDEADSTARSVVEGHNTLDIVFTYADPPISGFSTWPKYVEQKKTHHPAYTT